jgi:hypothetical protein
MTCVKTGAKVYFENYGMVVPADVFQVGDTYVIRWNPGGRHYCKFEDSFADWNVIQITNSEVWWHRDDLGVTVVPREYVRF